MQALLELGLGSLAALGWKICEVRRLKPCKNPIMPMGGCPRFWLVPNLREDGRRLGDYYSRQACQAQLHCLELGLLAQGLEGPGQGSGLAQDWAVDSANQCNPSPAFQADSGALAKPFQSTVFPAWAG